MTKIKSLQAKCQKLQTKSEANPRRPDTSTELLAGSSVAGRNETTNFIKRFIYVNNIIILCYR